MALFQLFLNVLRVGFRGGGKSLKHTYLRRILTIAAPFFNKLYRPTLEPMLGQVQASFLNHLGTTLGVGGEGGHDVKQSFQPEKFSDPFWYHFWTHFGFIF